MSDCPFSLGDLNKVLKEAQKSGMKVMGVKMGAKAYQCFQQEMMNQTGTYPHYTYCGISIAKDENIGENLIGLVHA